MGSEGISASDDHECRSAKLKAEEAGAGVVVEVETLKAVVVVETLAVAVEDGQ